MLPCLSLRIFEEGLGIEGEARSQRLHISLILKLRNMPKIIVGPLFYDLRYIPQLKDIGVSGFSLSRLRALKLSTPVL